MNDSTAVRSTTFRTRWILTIRSGFYTRMSGMIWVGRGNVLCRCGPFEPTPTEFMRFLRLDLDPPHQNPIKKVQSETLNTIKTDGMIIFVYVSISARLYQKVPRSLSRKACPKNVGSRFICSVNLNSHILLPSS